MKYVNVILVENNKIYVALNPANTINLNSRHKSIRINTLSKNILFLNFIFSFRI